MQKLNKYTTIYSITFSCVAMAVILFLSMNKVVTISGTEKSDLSGLEHANAFYDEADGEDHLLQITDHENGNYLMIPVSEYCKAENVAVENHYMDRELCIQIDNMEESFFDTHELSGNRTRILRGKSEQIGKSVRLLFETDSVYEYKTILEDNNLYITFVKPKEAYNRIVVIDPAFGGRDHGAVENGVVEKDLVLKVAKKLQEQLEKEKVKAYFTRLSDVNPSEEARAELANEIGADMFIRIQVGAYEDTDIYGVSSTYNENYFIPGFGNVELADLLEREIVISVKGKAIGLIQADETDTLIRQITVPAAAVKVGCVTNKQEAILLQRDDYQEKIATGIVNAIKSSSEMTE